MLAGAGGPAGGWISIEAPTGSLNSGTFNRYSDYPSLGEHIYSEGYGGFWDGSRPVIGESNISATGRTLVATSLAETRRGNFDGYYAGVTSASAYWADTISLVWRGGGLAPSTPSNVVMHFGLTATFNESPPSGYYNDNVYSTAVFASHYAYAGFLFNEPTVPGYKWWNVGASDQILPHGGINGGPPWGVENSQSHAFDGVVELGKYGGTGSFNFTLTATAKASYSSTYTRATMTMQSLLLPDGFTPESEGWEVVFGSGMLSPNVAVPEIDPNSFGSAFALLMGSLGLVERRTRKILGLAREA